MEGTMKLGGPRFFKRSVLLVMAGILLAVLTACTGKGGGYLPPGASFGTDVVFTSQATFGFTFSCQKGDLKIELSYNEKGRSNTINNNLISSPFGIHGIVDEVTPLDESQACIGDEPTPVPGKLTFLGRYYLTSSAPSGYPSTCPKKETSTTPLCRFEVIVDDKDQSGSPTPGDFFSIKLSTVTSIYAECPPDADPAVEPPCYITEFPTASVVYARAGFLGGGNITVK
jgi:predicted small lipoprotein YifL